MFHETAEGRYWAFITERAVAFGQGQPDRLAAVTFAKWLSVMGINHHWHEDLSFTIEPWGRVTIRASRIHDTSKIIVAPDGDYTFAVQLSGTIEPVACIAGSTYRSRWDELIEENPDGVHVLQLLSPADWLRAYPRHWTPCAEVAQAKNQTAGAEGRKERAA